MKGHNFAHASVLSRNETNAIRILKRVCLESVTLESRDQSFRTHLPRCDPSLSIGTPPCNQEAQSMPRSQGHASQKRPLFALQPVIILDVIRIRKKGIERQEWESVKVVLPWNGSMEARARYVGGLYFDGHPGCEE